MALPELAVMQQTFELLHQLDPQARRRVLKWVKAALDEADPAPVAAPAEHIDAGVQELTEPVDTGVVDEPAVVADIAGEPAPVAEAEESADDRDEATTPAAPSPTPPAGRSGRRAAKTAPTPEPVPRSIADAGGRGCARRSIASSDSSCSSC